MKKCKREQHGLPHFVLMRRLLKTCLANHCQSGGRLHVNILAWGLEKRSSQGTQTAQHPAWRSHFRKVSLQASLGDKSSGGGGVAPAMLFSPGGPLRGQVLDGMDHLWSPPAQALFSHSFLPPPIPKRSTGQVTHSSVSLTLAAHMDIAGLRCWSRAQPQFSTSGQLGLLGCLAPPALLS